ncbi:hypothetical protein L1275_000052 [Flavobacterium sp. HSC-61S13]|nr:hypothetical protein [Flavobacterium sp. HSC-61S13]
MQIPKVRMLLELNVKLVIYNTDNYSHGEILATNCRFFG